MKDTDVSQTLNLDTAETVNKENVDTQTSMTTVKGRLAKVLNIGTSESCRKSLPGQRDDNSQKTNVKGSKNSKNNIYINHKYRFEKNYLRADTSEESQANDLKHSYSNNSSHKLGRLNSGG